MSSENYERLVNVMIPLNHDRYKTYFVHFFAVNIAIFAGIANEFTDDIANAKVFLAFVGVVINIIWYLVQRKVQLDIKNVWSLIEKYEKCSEFNDCIRISNTPSPKGFPSSELMLWVPAGFLVVYIALGINLLF